MKSPAWTRKAGKAASGGLNEAGRRFYEAAYAPEVSKAADLGYCELLEFKCAANRVCSAWLVGGPIKKALTGRQRDMVLVAKAMIPPKGENGAEDMEEGD